MLKFQNVTMSECEDQHLDLFRFVKLGIFSCTFLEQVNMG